jgi:hypothetical protein
MCVPPGKPQREEELPRKNPLLSNVTAGEADNKGLLAKQL